MTDVQATISLLLERGLVAEDLILVREGESYINAFVREHGYYEKDKKVVFVLDNITSVFKYDLVFDYNTIYDYFLHADSPPEFKHIKIPKRMSVSEIDNILSNTNLGSWDSLTEAQQCEVLYNLGWDVGKKNIRAINNGDDINKNNNSWWIEYAMTRNKQTNKVENGVVVAGNERTDKEWLNGGHASYEAKIHTSDMELARELQSLR